MKRRAQFKRKVKGAAGQRGVAAVEFGLVAIVLFTLLFGAIEFGRLLFYWNATTEAARLGARVAVVCDVSDPEIRAKMRALFPVLADADINLDYRPAGCTVENCETITITINPKTIQSYIPFNPLTLQLPPFTTTLTRESMRSIFDDGINPASSNPVCG